MTHAFCLICLLILPIFNIKIKTCNVFVLFCFFRMKFTRSSKNVSTSKAEGINASLPTKVSMAFFILWPWEKILNHHNCGVKIIKHLF